MKSYQSQNLLNRLMILLCLSIDILIGQTSQNCMAQEQEKDQKANPSNLPFKIKNENLIVWRDEENY